ncbi:MAG: hypothetical protein J7J77_00305 [Candidatus Cloacimonetes bacterium]|nr:hypothetical protein [Candidatus Cloacimonadota bacterium]
MYRVEDTIKMGYCPTMEIFLNDIMELNPDIKLLSFGSAAQVLALLKEDYLNAGLIGRIAKKNEIYNEIKEMRLAKGYTLVGKFKIAIPHGELSNMEIHTYLPEEVVKSFIPEVNKVIYHKSVEDAVREGISSAILIDWDDYSDDYELIIPIEDEGKVLKFRTPTLYYHTKLESDIEVIEEKLKHTVVQKYEI